MFLQKKGFPEESELVICTVTNVQHHSVFARLDEYGKSGMIHISEVSPGRIRNLSDYVKEGKVIVCKVLKVTEDRGHIDLSLRRVSESQARKKKEGMKQEQKAEKIIETLAEKLKKPVKEIYEEVAKPILEEYEMIYPAFEAVVEEGLKFEDLGIKKDIASKLTKIITEKIKPKQVHISATIKITSYVEDGVEQVKKALMEAEKVDEKVHLRYVGAGTHKLSITAHDYKEAEDIMKKATEAAEKVIKKQKDMAQIEIIRDKND
ncbi:MAG: S1 RNA-binding domain-containing protein [archaeon]